MWGKILSQTNRGLWKLEDQGFEPLRNTCIIARLRFIVDNNVTLEEFRKILTKQYSQKGIKPPTPNGKKEKLLYQQWLKGKEKLQQLNNG